MWDWEGDSLHSVHNKYINCLSHKVKNLNNFCLIFLLSLNCSFMQCILIIFFPFHLKFYFLRKGWEVGGGEGRNAGRGNCDQNGIYMRKIKEKNSVPELWNKLYFLEIKVCLHKSWPPTGIAEVQKLNFSILMYVFFHSVCISRRGDCNWTLTCLFMAKVSRHQMQSSPFPSGPTLQHHLSVLWHVHGPRTESRAALSGGISAQGFCPASVHHDSWLMYGSPFIPLSSSG